MTGAISDTFKASVAFLALQFVCLHMLGICAGLCFCDGHYETGTSKLLTHLLESCFHFSVIPPELPGGSSFLTLYFYLPLLHSSQCLPDNNCDMNHF